MQQVKILRLALAAFLCAAVPAAANEGFSFKRVKPPEKGARKLITIQVEPKKEEERKLGYVVSLPALPDEPRPSRTPGAGGGTEWFWAQISPALTEARPSRMEEAVRAIEAHARNTGGFVADRNLLASIRDRYAAEILTGTAGTQVSPALIVAVIAVESAGRPSAQSSAGAVGLMQLMPATAKRFGVSDRTDPAQSIRGGAKYLDFLLNEFGGDPVLALAGYNAGEGAVRGNGGVPEYAETRAYVPKVMAAWLGAREMCLSPPVRATDGCLFAGLKVAAR